MNNIKEKIKNLPDAPGIYLFYNSQKDLIYVGKATSLKDRVRSYFVNNKKSVRPIEEMIHEVANIKYEQTDSVLEAVIVESIYIKKYLPIYNVLGKDDRSWNYIVITKDEYPRIKTMRQREVSGIRNTKDTKLPKMKIFGPYPGLNSRVAMELLRKIFRFSNCEPNAKRPCFYYQIGQCFGICTGEISPKEYIEKVVKPLALFLSGKKKQLIKEWERKMKIAAKNEDFEEAGRIRDQLFSLQKIQDIALLNKNFFEDELSASALGGYGETRIEGYDISNLGSSDKVASMVVFDRVGPVKSEYRKFRIKTVAGQSDVDSLAEVMTRRLEHPEWRLPDIFLIDGGKPQVNKVLEIVKSRNLEIPVVGIAKGPERKRNDFFVENLTGDKSKKDFLLWVHKNRDLLIKVRDEAHRFAITYHRERRNKYFLK